MVLFVALFLALSGFLVWELIQNGLSYALIKLALINVVVGYLVIKSLFVKNEMPNGLYVTEAEAGPLLRLVEELRKEIKTPKIHHIIVDESYNAYVTSFTKFGFFTPSKNILVVGLPLMMGLTEMQFKSVLAHELAHISNKDTMHGAFTNRVIQTWSQIIDTLERDNNRLRFLFTWFGKRYTPFIINQSFPLRRNAEYLADKKAAEATSPNTAAEALTRLRLKAIIMGHSKRACMKRR
ncbi:M48 family metallopeptidase [Paenibacillus sp. N4]|uniref:M48 family metallopeptidase n=1 Tax=Paenibacillus vietnamensis TaxID=2590547 RepID=UPI001CD09238|nr:M48 family metallopeptidase [Paenibacillus vietnamensis]MCA0757226.1 M48 family metallopeptidase [Paenibacillus vietnamensis]